MELPPREQAAPAMDVTTRAETLEVAGRTLPCVWSKFSHAEGALQVDILSWLCMQVPGFLVRSETRVSNAPEAESYEQTELLGFGGRTRDGCQQAVHPWADFAPGAWVRLRNTSHIPEGRDTTLRLSESYQRLLEVTDTEVEILMEQVTESGERMEEHIRLSLIPVEESPG